MFLNIKKEMGNIPLEVVNDGEVTALAGSINLKEQNPGDSDGDERGRRIHQFGGQYYRMAERACSSRLI